MKVSIVFHKWCSYFTFSINSSFNWLCAFLVSKFNKNIQDGIHASGSYFLFGAFCLVATLFVIFLTPETKGKTNEDMRNYFLEKAGRPVQNIPTSIENPNYERMGEEKGL